MQQSYNYTHRGVPSGEEDGEGWGEINVLVSQRDQHSSSSAPHFSVQHWVQDRIIGLHILGGETDYSLTN